MTTTTTQMLVELGLYVVNSKKIIMENPFDSILERLNIIENLIRNVKKDDPIVSSSASEIFNINQAAIYLGVAKSTVYKMTSNRLIPHSKITKRIYFKRNEIDEWINKHKIKTNVEIEQEADEYLLRKKKYKI